MTPQSQTDTKKTKTSPWRILLPSIFLVGWLVLMGIGGPYFGKVSEVSTNDSSSFLPETSEATQVQKILPNFNDQDAIPAILVAVSPEEISTEQISDLQNLMQDIGEIDGVGEQVSPFIPSEDGYAAEAFVPLDSVSGYTDTVEDIRDFLNQHTPDGWDIFVTGPAGMTADLIGAFSGIDGILLLVALIAVFIILLFVYRSALLPIAVLFTSVSALSVALLVVWWLAKAEILVLTGQTQGILFILVIGAATDYSLLYTSRYREELNQFSDKKMATRAALKGSFEPILASGGTVIAGLLCLLLSDLNSNKSLGPVTAIGIIFAMLAALTLLPSILMLLGRSAYWPKRPIYNPKHDSKTQISTGFYAKVGELIRRKPRTIWISTLLVLLAGAAFIPQLKADGVPQSEFVLGASDAREGQEALGEHFPGGSGTPAFIVAPEQSMQEVANILLDTQGISSVAVTTADSVSGTAQISKDGVVPSGRPGAETVAEPTVWQNQILLQATLDDASDSASAEQVIRDLRETLNQYDVMIGGTTAVAVDTQDTSIHDRNLIIPIILVVILFILMLLLRSILAPILLVATTVVSFGTAMGVSALVFNHIFDFPGADPVVPLYGFVFLVALGIDYNIFLMTRVREESLKSGTREGVLKGLAVTGGVITSAGIVLAATFTALSVLPILFLVQIAFIVAFGVLLDTFIVRTLVVPALVFDIGDAVWWPARIRKPKHKAASARFQK